ncbi:MAG: hypothetical protein ACI8WT_001749 [Clostridium sp.]|jgi:hypothetical protein
MNFKEVLKDDLNNVFFNNDEFSEFHLIDGKNISIIIDTETLKVNKIKAAGTYLGDVLFYAQKSDFQEIPVIGQRIKLDGELYSVNDIGDDNEMYEITLEAFMS